MSQVQNAVFYWNPVSPHTKMWCPPTNTKYQEQNPSYKLFWLAKTFFVPPPSLNFSQGKTLVSKIKNSAESFAYKRNPSEEKNCGVKSVLIEIAQRNICFNRGGTRFWRGSLKFGGGAWREFCSKGKGASGSILKGAKGGGALRKWSDFGFGFDQGFPFDDFLWGGRCPPLVGAPPMMGGINFCQTFLHFARKRTIFPLVGVGAWGYHHFW